VDPATLEPTSHATIGIAQHQGYTTELIRIQWRSTDPIDLFVVKPDGVKNPPVVLYLYSYPTDTAIFRGDVWCKRATEGGFAAVGFVSALTGDRYQSRPMKEWFVSELQESLGKSVHDVQMILNYLQQRGDLDMSQVGMFGQGSGGTIAALAAEADPRISFLDLLNPWGDWPDWLRDSPFVPHEEKADYLTPEFLKRVENLDPVRYLPKLKLKGLRVMQVMDDAITPPIVMKKIAAAVPHGAQLVQYEDLSAYREAFASVHSPWIHDQMRPSQPAQSDGNGQQPGKATVVGRDASAAAVAEVVP
jgi:hypothetical protein